MDVFYSTKGLNERSLSNDFLLYWAIITAASRHKLRWWTSKSGFDQNRCCSLSVP